MPNVTIDRMSVSQKPRLVGSIAIDFTSVLVRKNSVLIIDLYVSQIYVIVSWNARYFMEKHIIMLGFSRNPNIRNVSMQFCVYKR